MINKLWIIFAVIFPLWMFVDFRFKFTGFTVDIASIVAIFIVITILLNILLKRKMIKRKYIKYFLWIFLFFLSSLIACRKGNPSGFILMSQILFGIIIYFCMIQSIPNLYFLRRILKITLISTSLCILMLMILYLFYFNFRILGIHVFYPTEHARDTLSVFITIFAPISIAFLITQRKSKFLIQLSNIAIALIFIMSALYSGARGTWIAILGSVLVIICITRKWHIIPFLFLSFFIFSRLLLISGVNTEFLSDRSLTLLSFKEMEGRSSIYRRQMFLKDGLLAFESSPLIGIGLRHFSDFNEFGELSVHNDYVQILAEQGIIGFIPFIIFLGTLTLSSFRSMKFAKKIRHNELYSLSLALCASLVAILIRFGTLHFYDILPLWFIFGAIGTMNKFVQITIKNRQPYLKDKERIKIRT